MFSAPYDAKTPVTARAISWVSPNPTADAFADDSRTSMASEPLNPADVMVNNASANSWGPFAVSPDKLITSWRISATFSDDMPTNVSIFVNDLVKSILILIPAPATAANGIVMLDVIDDPTFFILPPNFRIDRCALANPFWNCRESNPNRKFKVLFFAIARFYFRTI